MPQEIIADVPGALLRWSLEPLTCPKCAYFGQTIWLTINENTSGTHHTAHCLRCGGYIQHLKPAAFQPLSFFDAKRQECPVPVAVQKVTESPEAFTRSEAQLRAAAFEQHTKHQRRAAEEMPGWSIGKTIADMQRLAPVDRGTIVHGVAAAWLAHYDGNMDPESDQLTKAVEKAVNMGVLVAAEMGRRL